MEFAYTCSHTEWPYTQKRKKKKKKIYLGLFFHFVFVGIVVGWYHILNVENAKCMKISDSNMHRHGNGFAKAFNEYKVRKETNTECKETRQNRRPTNQQHRMNIPKTENENEFAC